MNETRTMHNECWSCIHRREVPGSAHIQCAKPDPGMPGDQYGIRNGWFYYPVLFDPVWKTALCRNYEEEQEVKGNER